jgi:hypothetical protein
VVADVLVDKARMRDLKPIDRADVDAMSASALAFTVAAEVAVQPNFPTIAPLVT